MRRHSRILVFMILVSIVFYCFSPAPAARGPGPQGAGGGAGSETEQFDTSKERIGELRLGMPEKDIAGSIPCKQPKKGKEIFEGATGEYVRTWKYPECGIELKLGSERKGGGKKIESITVTPPADLATGRGIRIGSTEGEVVKAYGRYRDRDGDTVKGEKFVAGSIYDGLIFDIKDGKVSGIFLGAAAE